MTDEERQMLRDLHRALMENGDLGEPPLIHRIGNVVVTVERANWILKITGRIFLGAGALATAFIAITSAVKGMGGGIFPK